MNTLDDTPPSITGSGSGKHYLIVEFIEVS